VTLSTFTAVPESTDDSSSLLPPVVVVLHERYGMVQHTRDMASRLAGYGFAVVAPDLFAGDETAAPTAGEDPSPRPDGSRPRVRISDSHANQLIRSAIDSLADRAPVDTERVAVIGVCRTGRYALSYAATAPLACSIALYGAAQPRDWEVTADQPESLEGLIAASKAPFLGLFGELDHLISRQDVLRLRDGMERHSRSYRIHHVAGAPHGWLNDTMPGRYRADAAEFAWTVMVRFLRQHFEHPTPERTTWEYHADIGIDYDFASNVRLE
jgi:carboxymethylenebutenolidase